ncbi:MAG: hypothetical protein LRY53_04485 [Burkholderiaceae bacterium]|nr:hypothetical protein [Burkholderiaceae bacterium]MCD8564901.1 hypothetical protein [Burkholderiaceae bacterium]
MVHRSEHRTVSSAATYRDLPKREFGAARPYCFLAHAHHAFCLPRLEFARDNQTHATPGNIAPRVVIGIVCVTAALAAIKAMRHRWANPAMSANKMVSLFEPRQLPQTAADLRDMIDLI